MSFNEDRNQLTKMQVKSKKDKIAYSQDMDMIENQSPSIIINFASSCDLLNNDCDTLEIKKLFHHNNPQLFIKPEEPVPKNEEPVKLSTQSFLKQYKKLIIGVVVAIVLIIIFVLIGSISKDNTNVVKKDRHTHLKKRVVDSE